MVQVFYVSATFLGGLVIMKYTAPDQARRGSRVPFLWLDTARRNKCGSFYSYTQSFIRATNVATKLWV